MKASNPNGSNQYNIDPRQRYMWGLYVDPKSETFGNAYQSAIGVGYILANLAFDLLKVLWMSVV